MYRLFLEKCELCASFLCMISTLHKYFYVVQKEWTTELIPPHFTVFCMQIVFL